MKLGVAFDTRVTSHMSAGMRGYAEELFRRIPLVAGDVELFAFGAGDNFDAAEQLGMPAWIAREKPALVHYPTPFAPLFNPRPYVMTIHDLIELRYPAFSKSKAIPYYRYVTGRLARRAEAIICDDERTVDDLVRYLGVRSERVRVIPLGVSEAFLDPPELAEPASPYFLYVGNHRAHKDLPTLVQAWSHLPADCAIDLRFTGDNDIAALIEPYRRTDARIEFLGDLDLPALVSAYRGARALVHPSLIEGFGLPLLEASALGTPVIAADRSIPRILEEVVMPYRAGDVATLRLLLEQAVREPAAMRARGARGAELAQTYTWDRCASATAEVYREIARSA